MKFLDYRIEEMTPISEENYDDWRRQNKKVKWGNYKRKLGKSIAISTKAIIQETSSLDVFKEKQSSSIIWKGMVWSSKIINRCTKCAVGNGSSVRFWRDC